MLDTPCLKYHTGSTRPMNGVNLKGDNVTISDRTLERERERAPCKKYA